MWNVPQRKTPESGKPSRKLSWRRFETTRESWTWSSECLTDELDIISDITKVWPLRQNREEAKLIQWSWYWVYTYTDYPMCYTPTYKNVLHTRMFENIGYNLTDWTFYWFQTSVTSISKCVIGIQCNFQIQNLWQQQKQKIAETDLLYLKWKIKCNSW